MRFCVLLCSIPERTCSGSGQSATGCSSLLWKKPIGLASSHEGEICARPVVGGSLIAAEDGLFCGCVRGSSHESECLQIQSVCGSDWLSSVRARNAEVRPCR